MNRNHVAAAVLAIAVAASVAGCAGQAGLQAAAAPAPTSAQASSGSDMLADIERQVYGTADQIEAGEQRQFYALHAAWGQCVRAKGVDYEVPAYPSGGRGLITPSPGDLLAWAPHYADFAIARRAEVLGKTGTPENPAFLRLTTDAQRERWTQAQADCQEAANTAQDADLPDNMMALDTKLIDELAKLQNDLAPTLVADYTACMAGAVGVKVEEGTIADAYTAAAQKFPPTDAAKPFDPSTLPGWGEAVSFEKTVAAADWTCRGAAATRVVDAGAAELSAWAEQNRGQLEAVAAAWAAMPAARDAARTAAQAATAK